MLLAQSCAHTTLRMAPRCAVQSSSARHRTMLHQSLLGHQSGCASGRRPCNSLHQQPCLRQARLASPVQALKGFGLPAITNQKKNKCPCGSGSEYAVRSQSTRELSNQWDQLPLVLLALQKCCQKLHQVQQLKPSSPEQLLRARFAAYVKKGEKGELLHLQAPNAAEVDQYLHRF